MIRLIPAIRWHGRCRFILHRLFLLLRKARTVKFRWVAVLALWTILIGPVLGPPPSSAPSAQAKRPITSKIKS